MFKKDKFFFTALETQADFMVQAAELFMFLVQDFDHSFTYIPAIDDLEHKADEVRHELSRRIDAAFITPMDKDDLTHLADKLDDVTDCIESVTERMDIYAIDQLRDDLEPMIKNLLAITKTLYEAVCTLSSKKSKDSINDLFIKIHQLENETDTMFIKALGELFATQQQNPVYIMIWKEIYDRVEKAVDKCEDAANIVESMVVKYA